MSTSTTFAAYDRIFAECGRQAHSWGSAHDDHIGLAEWAGIMSKYVGRFAEAAVEGRGDIAETSAVKIGALCVSFLNARDRQRVAAAAAPSQAEHDAEVAKLLAQLNEVEAEVVLRRHYAEYVEATLNAGSYPRLYADWRDAAQTTPAAP